MLPTLDKVASALVGDSPFLANTLRYAAPCCCITCSSGSMSNSWQEPAQPALQLVCMAGLESGHVQGGQD